MKKFVYNKLEIINKEDKTDTKNIQQFNEQSLAKYVIFKNQRKYGE